MSLMEKNESFERFREGIKKSASICRQLSAAQDNRNWTKIAFSLEGLLNKGTEYYMKKQISRQEALSILEQHQKEIKT